MRIDACRAEDVAALERFMPSHSVDGSHEARFARQEAGRSTYLIPRLDGRPVGHAEVRWTGCAAAEVRAARPGCPEINGLLVWPRTLRSRGIGGALVRAAEELAVARGTGLMGLGVGDDNPRAAALYTRLGYRPVVTYVDRWAYLDVDGERRECTDPCVFMVKHLDVKQA
ncbi:GNAT family N-acetyltransferase [Streptomyces sp. Qhu-G9]|uniref:GNAT family N-acetyltransferase n=1 Tax=Streptomyces sp. Qhu-G9 TaxID=3452799 RepID=UPI0022AC6EED|nr:GNAT family N-acetyltransferase [Streptomyces aurantiacus]WAU80907.1 GNAT family N-acetyltransferase [Streptomyces aurantiacus]